MLSEERKERNKKLLERLASFASDVILLCQKLPKTIVNIPLIKQIVRSASSIGANYNEACEAESAKDFVHKIGITKKECKETLFWLKLLETPKENEPYKNELVRLAKEANEYVLLFSAIIVKFRVKR